MKINNSVRFIAFVIFWVGFVVASTILIIRLYNTIKTSPLWQVRKVQVEGLKRVSEKEILKILDLPPQVSVWDLNLLSLENKLSGHPWIEKAVVKWRFPGVILVTVVERYPVAILCCDACFYVDANGQLFSQINRKDISDSDVPWFTFCPQVLDKSFRVSEVTLAGFSALMQALRNFFGPLWKNAEVSYSPKDGFVVKIQGIKALLGTEDVYKSVARLQYMMQGLKMLEKSENFHEIDVRYPRWAFIR
ncbi:MAG: FtsQ-type POTRA domain-containing protein [Thermodesulforhabdaceae bacterium]